MLTTHTSKARCALSIAALLILTATALLAATATQESTKDIFLSTLTHTATIIVNDPVNPDGSPGSGVIKLRFSDDNQVTWTPWVTLPAPVATYTTTFPCTFVNGTNVTVIEAWDNVGNIGFIKQVFKVDANPPVGSIQ